ncbi:glycoside hydrolase family 16 protein [Lophiostoma macrostomum CBS 122681]|uniref:endo-1,3(4)-beta-glucanase n=1 Tax=Lophiostoma macrostomum CBS 122681 TaxID=1314788 RepID=A0A6A6T4D9_9PLEO|nr:glycoside hydrolase family 16 protein [Lophiostoma macrostomum CBS 122681]
MLFLHSLPTFFLYLSFLDIFCVDATYTLVDNFSGPSLLTGFNFRTAADPTHGFVRYLSQSSAQSQGLLTVSSTTVKLGVDSTNKAPNGRASIRLESKKLYNRGLFMLDLTHMPASTCGTWPSFWTWGAERDWPLNGEIGIHTTPRNAMSLHTSPNCTISSTPSTSLGRIVTTNCDINAAGQTSNAGCGIESPSTSSLGTPFNAGGGGVYAMEWTTSGIKIWQWARADVPDGVRAGGASLDTSMWGTPQAGFLGGDCDFDRHFLNHQIVIDTTFCGDWAGALWGANAECTAKAASCNDYVANNPSAFAESYWTINSLKVYKQ